MAPDGEQIWVPGQSMSRSRSHMSLSPSSPLAAAPTAGKPILSLASRVNIRGSRRVYAHSTLLTFSMFNRCSFCICLLEYFRRLLNHQNVGIRGEAKNPQSVSWRYKLFVSDIKGLIYGMTFTYTIDEEAKYMYKYKYTYKHKYIYIKEYMGGGCVQPWLWGQV